MSRGIGVLQRRILQAMADKTDWNCWAIAELAECLDRPMHDIREAVRSLERRELVVVTHGYTGWKGRGRYGRLDVVRPGDRGLPRIRRHGHSYVRMGMPIHGLLVWLPERSTH